MLPAWAAVAIAFAGALGGIVAAFFSLRGTARTIRHQESEAWKSRLIDAAYFFGDNWTAYSNFAGYTFKTYVEDFPSVSDPVIADRQIAAEEKKRHTPTSNSVIRVKVLFGDGKGTAGEAADEAFHTAVEVVEQIREGLRASNDELRQVAWKRASEGSWAADDAYARFNRLAHLAIRPQRRRLWRRPKVD
jgi:hypothetical protein